MRVLSCARGPLFIFRYLYGMCVLCALSASMRVLDVPVDECPMWYPWCVSLLVPGVRFFFSTALVRWNCTTDIVLLVQKKRRSRTNDRRTKFQSCTQRRRVHYTARSKYGSCVVWVGISSSSSSHRKIIPVPRVSTETLPRRHIVPCGERASIYATCSMIWHIGTSYIMLLG